MIPAVVDAGLDFDDRLIDKADRRYTMTTLVGVGDIELVARRAQIVEITEATSSGLALLSVPATLVAGVVLV